MTPDTPEALFAARLAADPSAPLVTFYDDASGERAELSAKSLANWVAKTHFLVMDGLGLGVGDAAQVALPVHWLAAPILLGCWFAGIEVRSTPDGASVVFGDEGGLPADLADFDEVYAVSLLSMARPGTPPPGAQDYATAVRPMPDAWASVRAQAGADDPALDGRSRAELVRDARQAASELGLAPGARLLWERAWTGPADWISSLLAPLAVGGSVVLVRNADPARTAGRAAGERASVPR